MRFLLLAVLVAAPVATTAHAQRAANWTRADSLRGSLTAPERTWWDVTYYDLNLRVSPSDSTIRGSNTIAYRVVGPTREMQIDLHGPLVIDSVVQDGRALAVRHDGNAHFVTVQAPQPMGAVKAVTVFYGGRPYIAPRPPWDGGFTWTTDSLGNPWVVTTDQGVGASIWWPNKDLQADEPDSQRVALRVPDPLINVSAGRFRSAIPHGDGTTTYVWFNEEPINNYAIAVATGRYAHYTEIYDGEAGKLTLDFWPLSYNVERAKAQWAQVRPMMKCFEHWFGPYPWYKDGYKLIEVPNTGMEHQTAVTYGNRFANGYRGRDDSGTGYGLQWDFIIIHESAHEWWGNNITTKDLADMWVHESFANYAEALYTECQFGVEAGAAYARGVRRDIRNDRPIIPGAYGVNAQGSGDMYPKGGTMLHMIRQLLHDDDRWRAILRGLNAEFWHQTVTGAQVEAYLARETRLDLSKVFDQYLRDVRIPVLELASEGADLYFRWTNVVDGFAMPVPLVGLSTSDPLRLRPTTTWQSTPLPQGGADRLLVDPNYYVTLRLTTR
jgi:aminopeptidase N